jgi:hypothetical protein
MRTIRSGRIGLTSSEALDPGLLFALLLGVLTAQANDHEGRMICFYFYCVTPLQSWSLGNRIGAEVIDSGERPG